MFSLPFTPNMKVAELGGGNKPLFHPNVDIRQVEGVDIVSDLSKELPFETESYDGLYASYVLEHISWRDIERFLKDVYRILKPNGVVVFVTANLKEQAKVLALKETWEQKDVCMLFGDQDYKGNYHCSGFSPEYVMDILGDIGFGKIIIATHPQCPTDMIIEAYKSVPQTPDSWTTEDRKKIYNREYFDGGGEHGGYWNEGYLDYPVHWTTFFKVMERKPESILELGAARGYLVKRFLDVAKIKAYGMEISDHCYKTRAVDEIIQHDITKTPYPFKDKEFDLCFSSAVLEHIPENNLPDILKEINRVCKRGLHGISFQRDEDLTHTTIRPIEWWREHFGTNQEIADKESLENELILPSSDSLVKLNIGSFKNMFHGWVNLDIHNLTEWANRNQYKFLQCDVARAIPFDSNSTDLIFISHMLEHITQSDGMIVLQECHRVMKEGAIIRIAVPDTKKLVGEYLSGTLSKYDDINEPCAQTELRSMKLWNLLCSNHSICYDEESLASSLEKAGFKNIQRRNFRDSASETIKRETIDMYPELSLYVEAVKLSYES
jgi:predicted SAM-dependent methyltransferase